MERNIYQKCRPEFNIMKHYAQSSSDGLGTSETGVLEDSPVTVRPGRDDTDVVGVLDSGQDSGGKNNLLPSLSNVDEVDTCQVEKLSVDNGHLRYCCKARAGVCIVVVIGVFVFFELIIGGCHKLLLWFLSSMSPLQPFLSDTLLSSCFPSSITNASALVF